MLLHRVAFRCVLLPSLLALLVAGCGSSSSDASSVKCQPVSVKLQQRVQDGMKPGSRVIITGKMAAVDAPGRDGIQLLAATLDIPGIGREIAVFASVGEPAADGAILAVDGLAKLYSTHQDAAKSSAKMAPTVKGVVDVRSCLEVKKPAKKGSGTTLFEPLDTP